MKWILGLLIIYLIMSIVTVVVYSIDKDAAQKKRRRISEHTLQMLALACGWPGAFMAQQWLRHKNQKRSFLVMCGVMALVNVLIVGFVVYLV
ncbi:MAG TPA: DUF1294 domain-containing protein [Gemmatales bacterium]|nr:DUF1294 domain-containing protein [Gemmatales bacterium]